MDRLAARISITLKTLGASQIICGIGGTLAISLFVSQELLEIVGEEIMISGRVIQLTAIFLMFLVVASGIISVFRMPWGWLFSFTAASVVLVMALLMGPGTIPITKWSFLVLMALSLINWTAAVIYYYHDLYT